ncbi:MULTISPECIES: hypothetical protein [Bacillus cereus group]|uniref:Uncharacterized protein n=1 Tax=Bacillus cereus TaxID=1396 RepID=A0AA44Q6C6_BACCE|nr:MULTISPECIES: hypothetical protein [Bacillus cereus group]EEL48206.1 hypothetical protein bcere0022_45590 [Bacillus cereus Rock3-44]PFN07068.1 hypothetical protein COJ55_12030 [Bacillus cereus]PFO80428.1 hypothetical protein COJ77_18380 [Bacillus cereus]PFR30850.1 hypothetical protein COK19_04095 [Bacillus cereus]PFR89963.1 hypothetical protein COK38_23845 [Bacillus cereus]
MIDVKLFEVLHGYENGKFKDGDMFFYHNNPNMAVIFNAGSLIWADDRVAVSCKEILKDAWVYKEA